MSTGRVDISLKIQDKHHPLTGLARVLERRLEKILTRGEAVELPDDILEKLRERRELARQINPWVNKAHHRPGKRL